MRDRERESLQTMQVAHYYLVLLEMIGLPKLQVIRGESKHAITQKNCTIRNNNK